MRVNIDPKAIGIIGGGERKPTSVIDIALFKASCVTARYRTLLRTTAMWSSMNATIFPRYLSI
jgi:hypothetical protein